MAHLQRLNLTAFRNYPQLRIEAQPGPSPVVITGPNGAGKSNLLEAISLLGPGRGMRNARLSEMARAGGHDPWAVAAAIETRAGTRDVGTGGDPGSERRVVRIDGMNRSQGALASVAAILWLTPAMDRLFAEPASARRRFIDRIVYGFDPTHATRLNRYDQALRERQKLLEDQRHPTWLDGIEHSLAETGIAIAAARLRVVARLHQACALAQGPFPCPELRMRGDLEGWLEHEPALAVEDRFRALLAANRGSDRAAGRCAAGAHRSDFVARYRDKNMDAALCSTGEQKGLLVSTILANVELMKGEPAGAPILLLDEVAAHLDPVRRDMLFDRVASAGLQAWITGTERETFRTLEQSARYFAVRDGIVYSDP